MYTQWKKKTVTVPNIRTDPTLCEVVNVITHSVLYFFQRIN